MAALDTVGMLCSAMSAPVVAGHIQTLLNQAGLPVTMAVSFLVLGARFLLPQYIGSALIIGGKCCCCAAVDATNIGVVRPSRALACFRAISFSFFILLTPSVGLYAEH
jgi:hypothetical protein